MNRFAIFGLIFISFLSIYIGCGGTSTETVGKVGIVGQLVDSIGVPIVDAKVTITPVSGDTTNTYDTTTDENGKYHFDGKDGKIELDIYRLFGNNPDTSLTITIDSINFNNPEDTVDLGVDTMYGPGWIAGHVTVGGLEKTGVDIFIPGTSFMAKSDEQGGFTINQVPSGRFQLVYIYPDYHTGRLFPVDVPINDTVHVPTVNLIPDTTKPPPPPGPLSSSYDTLTGIITLTWDQVQQVADLRNYAIFLMPDQSPIAYPKDTTYNHLAFPTIPEILDTSHYSFTFQAKSQDNQNNLSTVFSPPCNLRVPSPTIVRTFFTWTEIPNDTIYVGDEVDFAFEFNNMVRRHQLVRWMTKPSSDTDFDTISVDSIPEPSGTSKLRHAWDTSGIHVLRIEALDERNNVWCDSIYVEIQDTIIPDDEWRFFPFLKEARRQLRAAVVNDTMYAIGGIYNVNEDVQCVETVEAFAEGDSTWRIVSKMDTARSDFMIAAVSGKIYIIGGSYKGVGDSKDFTSIKSYNPGTGEWKTEGEMPVVRAFAAACVYNGTIYITGGLTRSGFSDDINIFDPQTGTWKKKGSMLHPRINHQVVAADDKLFIIGGMDQTQTILASVEMYDPVTNSSKNIAKMSTPRQHLGAAAFGDSIYVFGGFYNNKTLKTCEAYNLATENWEVKKDMLKGLSRIASCVFKGHIFAIGGTDKDESPFMQVPDVQIYYP